jgi:drug/metabolite transporter (DMT)-like permease
LTVSNWNAEIVINSYVFYIVLATLFYAISINVIKRYLGDLDAIHISALAFLFVGPPMAFYIFNTDFIILAQSSAGFEALIYIIILAVIGTSFAVVLFNYLLKQSSAIFASSVTYLIPIVAIAWGVFDGENILIQHLIGAAIILTGVYLVNKKKPTPK